MLASALVVVLATLAAERSGPFWGALIASLPLSAGPIYVMLALDHDAAFLSESAVGSMAATAATAVYILALTLACPRLPVAAGVPLSLLIWLGCIVAIRTVPWSIVSSGALATGALLLSMAVTAPQRALRIAAPARRRAIDVPLRAILVALLAGIVTSASAIIGPEATGIAAVFPIVMTSLAVILQLRQGGQAVAAIMASSFLPMVGFVVALLGLHYVAISHGAVAGLSAALAGSVVWSLLLAGWRLTRPRPTAHDERPTDPASRSRPGP